MYENLTRLDLVGPALARALGDPGWERLEASLVSGGKSNLTFELTSDAGEAVLRRPPDGPLLPRAHDMGREARIQRALAGTVVPVARILFEGWCVGAGSYTGRRCAAPADEPPAIAGRITSVSVSPTGVSRPSSTHSTASRTESGSRR